jgi:CbiX
MTSTLVSLGTDVKLGADMKQGLLLIAHGARDPAWARPFEAIAARIADRAPERVVRIAYLDHLAPNIDAASGALVREGCQRIDVLPMFLGAGVPARAEEHRQHVDALAAFAHQCAAGGRRTGAPPSARALRRASADRRGR